MTDFKPLWEVLILGSGGVNWKNQMLRKA